MVAHLAVVILLGSIEDWALAFRSLVPGYVDRKDKSRENCRGSAVYIVMLVYA